MNALDAADLASDQVLSTPLAQKVLLDIETSASAGMFETEFTSDFGAEPMSRIAKSLQHLGYRVNVADEGTKLYIRWSD